MLTPKAKQGLAVFGKNGILAAISGTIVALGVILGTVKLWGEALIVTPIVRSEVQSQVDEAKEECSGALSKHISEASEVKKENDRRFQKQEEINTKILDKLSELSVITAELRTEARIMNKLRQEGK